MDTDYLTPAAHDMLSMAHDVFEPMRAEVALSGQDCRTEDEFLFRVIEFLDDVLADPSGYLDYWNALDDVDTEKFTAGVTALVAYVRRTMETPYNDRGTPDF